MQKKGTNVWNSKALAFLKRNIYYLLMIVCVLAIGAVVTTVAVLNTKDPSIDAGGATTPPPIVNPDKPTPEPDKPDPPVVTRKFVVTMPVSSGVLSKEYSGELLVWDTTLRQYSAHMGADISAELGTSVIAGFEGVVESITSDAELGTVITIAHQDGFKSVYMLLDEPTVKEGDKVTDTTVIGVVGEFLFEVSDGPHVHYELMLDGVNVDPMLYVLADDK